MASPEKYRAGYPDKLEKNLFILSDSDGSRNLEVSKVVRLMQRELGSQEAFIGLAPLGSSTVGYATREKHGEHNAESDLDIAVFYDSSIDLHAEKKLEKIFSREHRLAIKDGTYTFPSHLPGTHRHDLNMDLMRNVLNRAEENPEERGRVIRALVSLSGLAVGPRIDEYRRLIGEEMDKMPRKDRDTLIVAMGHLLVRRDRSREKDSGLTQIDDDNLKFKLDERMLKEVPKERVREIMEAREDLWQRRIFKVFGLEIDEV